MEPCWTIYPSRVSLYAEEFFLGPLTFYQYILNSYTNFQTYIFIFNWMHSLDNYVESISKNWKWFCCSDYWLTCHQGEFSIIKSRRLTSMRPVPKFQFWSQFLSLSLGFLQNKYKVALLNYQLSINLACHQEFGYRNWNWHPTAKRPVPKFQFWSQFYGQNLGSVPKN